MLSGHLFGRFQPALEPPATRGEDPRAALQMEALRLLGLLEDADDKVMGPNRGARGAGVRWPAEWAALVPRQVEAAALEACGWHGPTAEAVRWLAAEGSALAQNAAEGARARALYPSRLDAAAALLSSIPNMQCAPQNPTPPRPGRQQ